MKRLGFMLALLVLPQMVFAQTVRIQTGEHAAFTRVVLYIPEGSDWQLGRVDAGYALRIPGVDGYNLDGFYDLIPRNRITGIEQNQQAGELTFFVTCPCNAQAFLFRPDVLVIDIRDGQPVPLSTFETPLSPTDAGLSPAPQVPPYLIGRQRLFSLLPEKTIPAAPSRPAQAATPDPEPSPPPDPVPDDTGTNLAALEQSILESLGRGLSDGVLDGVVPDAADAGNGLETPAGRTDRRLPGLNATTGVDVLAVPDSDAIDVTQTGRVCLPDSYFDVANWGDDRPFFAQINPARAELISEFDMIKSEAVTTLAQRYIYFGFGREAQQTLDLDQRRSQDRMYLGVLARLMDDAPVMQGQFAEQISCPSSVALWAMLAASDLPFDAQVDRIAVLRTFKTLPLHLQKHLGPRLSERFLAIGDKDAALQALNASRGDENQTVDSMLVNAAITQVAGDSADALQIVTDLARTDPRVTPRAMVQFFQNGIDQGLAFSDDDFLLADSLRFENQSDDFRVPLSVAQIQAYLASERYHDADALLAEERALITAEDNQDLSGQILQGAAGNLDDVAFLQFIWQKDLSAQTPETQNIVAGRLIDTGFPARALAIMTTPGTAQDARTRRNLRARAAIALEEPETALDLLQDQSSEEAIRLRDEAELLLIDQAIADGQDQRAALPQGFGDAQMQVVSDTAQLSEPEVTDSAAPLAGARDLLERSAQSRVMLEEMLQGFSVDADP